MTRKFLRNTLKVVCLAALFAASFAGCDDWFLGNGSGEYDGGGGGGSIDTNRTVTVKNNSSYEITSVSWIYSTSIRSNVVNTIGAGKEATLTVDWLYTGYDGYIHFNVNNGTVSLSSTSSISLNNEFAISDSTMVKVNDKSDTGPLSKYATRPTNATLTIKNESAYEVTSVLWNNVSFAGASNSIPPGTSATMGVDAGSGYVRLRPTSNPYNLRIEELLTVAVGEKKEFVILNTTTVRKDIDNNTGTLASIAGVQFTAKVGDLGPGGGTIFFASGGQYKEVSGELGLYNWGDADKTARDHRGGGFDDWQLSTSGDLTLMYDDLHKKGLGGFSKAIYWGQKSNNSSYPYYCFNFETGKLSTSSNDSYRTRAVRSFSTN